MVAGTIFTTQYATYSLWNRHYTSPAANRRTANTSHIAQLSQIVATFTGAQALSFVVTHRGRKCESWHPLWTTVSRISYKCLHEVQIHLYNNKVMLWLQDTPSAKSGDQWLLVYIPSCPKRVSSIMHDKSPQTHHTNCLSSLTDELMHVESWVRASLSQYVYIYTHTHATYTHSHPHTHTHTLTTHTHTHTLTHTHTPTHTHTTYMQGVGKQGGTRSQ